MKKISLLALLCSLMLLFAACGGNEPAPGTTDGGDTAGETTAGEDTAGTDGGTQAKPATVVLAKPVTVVRAKPVTVAPQAKPAMAAQQVKMVVKHPLHLLPFARQLKPLTRQKLCLQRTK